MSTTIQTLASPFLSTTQVSYLRAPELFRHGSCLLWLSSALMLTSAAATGLSQFAPPVAHSILLLLIISIAMPSIAGIESRWMGSLQRVAVAGCYMAIIGFFATRMMPSSGTLIALVVVAFSAWLLPIVRSPERVGLLSMTSVAVLGVVPLFA